MELGMKFSEPTEVRMAVEFTESTQNADANFGELQVVTTGAIPSIGVVTLLADAWVGGNNVYSQVVSIKGVTKRSQVDSTPDAEQLAAFREKDLAFVTENEDGVVTVYAIGQKPNSDYTIQVTITEVSV